MERAKGCWEVRAGLIPGQALKEYHKQFPYTSAEAEEDEQHRTEIAYQTFFNRRQFEALSYYLQLNDPRYLNWVEMTFIWF
jgi:hypothetical protein